MCNTNFFYRYFFVCKSAIKSDKVITAYGGSLSASADFIGDSSLGCPCLIDPEETAFVVHASTCRNEASFISCVGRAPDGTKNEAANVEHNWTSGVDNGTNFVACVFKTKRRIAVGEILCYE